MNAAKLHKSQRLQAVDRILVDGREHSTLEIIHAAGVCAVNSIIAELRSNGRQIECTRRGNAWYYRMDVATCPRCGAPMDPNVGRYGCANC